MWEEKVSFLYYVYLPVINYFLVNWNTINKDSQRKIVKYSSDEEFSMIFSTMPSSMWISRVMWSVLLYSSLQYQRTSGNRTIPASYYNCACYNKHGLFYLAPLQSKDGTPRFVMQEIDA